MTVKETDGVDGDIVSSSLQVAHVAKAYGAVHALVDVSFQAEAGEVTAIVGENGAGKSTLVRMLVGLISPDSGRIILGDDATCRGPVTAAFQESSLLPNLTVAENLFFGEPQPWWRMHTRRGLHRRARQALAAVDAPPIPVEAVAADLTVAQRQIIEVAKAVLTNPAVLVLDEANSALSGEYNDWFLAQARSAATHGRVVLLITHRLAEVRAVASRITVLRGGRSVLKTTPAESSNAALIEAMIGHRYRESAKTRLIDHDAPIVFTATDLRPRGALDTVDITVRRGEIVGLAGLDGQGQSQVIRAIAGSLRSYGTMIFENRHYSPATPKTAVRRGIAFVPADRQSEGLLPDWSISANLSLSSLRRITNRFGLIDRARESQAVEGVASRLRLPVDRLAANVNKLSGGNQQRVVLGRVLLTSPRFLLLFDGTRGVDVATRESILAELSELASTGVAILFYSSDLTEYTQIADRVEVMSSGRIAGSVSGDDVSEENILRIAVEAQRADRVALDLVTGAA